MRQDRFERRREGGGEGLCHWRKCEELKQKASLETVETDEGEISMWMPVLYRVGNGVYEHLDGEK